MFGESGSEMGEGRSMGQEREGRLGWAISSGKKVDMGARLYDASWTDSLGPWCTQLVSRRTRRGSIEGRGDDQWESNV